MGTLALGTGRRLRGSFGKAIIILVVVVITLLIATSTVGATGTLENPIWDTVQALLNRVGLLEERQAALETRVSELEGQTGTRTEETRGGTESTLISPDEFLSRYPYTGQVTPELVGKLEVRYRFQFGPDRKPGLEYALSDESMFHVYTAVHNISSGPLEGYTVHYRVTHVPSGFSYEGWNVVTANSNAQGFALPGETRSVANGSDALAGKGIRSLEGVRVDVILTPNTSSPPSSDEHPFGAPTSQKKE